MDDLIARTTDVHRTLAYSGRKMSRKYLWLGLLLLVLGGLIVYFQTGSFSAEDKLMLTLTFGLGGAITLYALIRLVAPGKPLLTLSPAGVRIRIEWLKEFLIPWREVKGIDTIDISGTMRGHTITFNGVTVVLVSRKFYDRHIHVNSWFLRGPGWDFNFIPKGPFVQVALHHEALPATAAELREATQARWKAFRNADRTSVPAVNTDG